MNGEKNAGWRQKINIKTIVFSIVWVLLLLVLVLWIKPFYMGEIAAASPADSYDAAMTQIAAVQADEEAQPEINPICYTRVMTHGQEVRKAIVLLHGFTSCPEQFVKLGEAYFDLGYNVYIPRTPHHGLLDRSGTALQELTAEEMATFANQSVDIAHGLGDEIIVSGLSGGGTIAAWVGQNRNDVVLAQPLAPFMGIGFLPTLLSRPLTNLILMVPNFFLWWDPRAQENNPLTAPYAYPRYATHGLAEVMRLGFITQSEARDVPPPAPNLIMVTNDNDESVDNAINDRMTTLWRDHETGNVDEFVFEKELGLPHDIITPTRPGNRVDLVYPILIELTESNQ